VLNVLARLGWTRYVLFKVGRRLVGTHAAVALFAPTGWSKLHDELKIYGGYFRFIPLIGLVIARYMMFGELVLDGPKAPAFNPSAACALLALLMLEILEDNIVLRELLPMSPLPRECIEAKGPQAKPDPGNLISVEVRPRRSPISDPWRLDELNNKGERRASNLAVVPDHPPEPAGPQFSLGPRRASTRSRIRQWFGQQRAVIPALTLHGLREMPFSSQIAAIAITCEVTLGMLNTTLSPGFARGLCAASTDFHPMVMLRWPVPMQC